MVRKYTWSCIVTVDQVIILHKVKYVVILEPKVTIHVENAMLVGHKKRKKPTKVSTIFSWWVNIYISLYQINLD